MFPNESSGSCSTMAQCYCGCRSALCECAPALEPITYWGNFFICLFCEDDLFFGFSGCWMPPLLAVFCLGVTVQRGHSRLGCSKMQQKQQQKKVKERWEDWCVCACAGAGGAVRLLPTHRCHPPACPVSQRSGSWLVFSDDVTVPSAD